MKKTKEIADYYGKEHQTIKAIEELAELIQALAKGDIENIKEEIADVRVMLDQIEYLYGISDDAITLQDLYMRTTSKRRWYLEPHAVQERR